MKRLIILVAFVFFFTGSINLVAAQNPRDSAVAGIIRQELSKAKGKQLLYPKSVVRFYRQKNFRPVWLNIKSSESATWKAMLILDCVVQFGLSHSDYHPDQLTYGLLHDILEKPTQVSNLQMATFDLMLTDAMIALINHLHYGKLNPDYGSTRLDVGLDIPLAADAALGQMLAGPDRFNGIADLQPKSKAYTALQAWMHKWKGQYAGDCYEVPEADVRRVAINMERLRWADINDSTAYIQVNIPTYNLTYHLPADTNLNFKVVVGKPVAPTPVLQSQINYFTTAPEWQVPNKIFETELLPKALKDPNYLKQNNYVLYDREGILTDVDLPLLQEIKKHPANYYARQSAGCDNALGMLVFRFNNRYDVYLHDTPEQQLFNVKNRALSHGCIRVQNAAGLAGLLLKYDGQAQATKHLTTYIKKQKRRNFILNTPVPIKITYLTCEVKEGQVVSYNDVYQLDKRLETALYSEDSKLSMR